MSQAIPTVQLTAEERDNLWYMPQQPGGRIVPEPVGFASDAALRAIIEQAGLTEEQFIGLL